MTIKAATGLSEKPMHRHSFPQRIFARLSSPKIGTLQYPQRQTNCLVSAFKCCDLLRQLRAQCPADIAPSDGDGKVDIDDLLMTINAWGECGDSACPADVIGNGIVDVDDLMCVISSWGPCQ
jgi:hypothetical protein